MPSIKRSVWSSRNSMMSMLMFRATVGMATLLSSLTVHAVVIQVTIIPVKIAGFMEFKCESDQRGEQATGHITSLGAKTFEWELGGKTSATKRNNIWFWWDTLQGVADTTITVYQDTSRD